MEILSLIAICPHVAAEVTLTMGNYKNTQFMYLH